MTYSGSGFSSDFIWVPDPTTIILNHVGKFWGNALCSIKKNYQPTATGTGRYPFKGTFHCIFVQFKQTGSKILIIYLFFSILPGSGLITLFSSIGYRYSYISILFTDSVCNGFPAKQFLHPEWLWNELKRRHSSRCIFLTERYPIRSVIKIHYKNSVPVQYNK